MFVDDWRCAIVDYGQRFASMYGVVPVSTMTVDALIWWTMVDAAGRWWMLVYDGGRLWTMVDEVGL